MSINSKFETWKSEPLMAAALAVAMSVGLVGSNAAFGFVKVTVDDDCGDIQTKLDEAADGPFGMVLFEPGTYELDCALEVSSDTRIRGPFLSEERPVLQATVEGNGIFLLHHVENVVIADLELQMVDDGIPPASSELEATQRAVGITVSESRNVRIRRIKVVDGWAGIGLLDTSGGEFHMWPGHPGECGTALPNEDITVSESEITGQRAYGLWLLNAHGSRFVNNHISAVQGANAPGCDPQNPNAALCIGDGIKLACGPVTDNLISNNYLHDNWRDGLDANAGKGVKDYCSATGEELAVCPEWHEIADNRIIANIVYDNLLDGMEIKSDVNHGSAYCGPPNNSVPLIDDRYAIGDVIVRHNIVFGNGISGIKLQKSSPIGLRCEKDSGLWKRSRLAHNVVFDNRQVADEDEGSGIFFNQARHVFMFRNWIGDHGGEHDVYGNGTSPKNIGLFHNFVPLDRIRWFKTENPATMPDTVTVTNSAFFDPDPTEEMFHKLVQSAFAAGTGYHNTDSDGDGCSNGEEVVYLQSDPLDPNPECVEELAALDLP